MFDWWSFVIFCTQKQPELTREVSFSSSSVVHHWCTIEGSCTDVSILTNKLLHEKRVSYECNFGIFLLVHFDTLFSKQNLTFSFHFLNRSVLHSIQKVFPRYGEHNACHCQGPCWIWAGITMVVKVDCCRGVVEVDFIIVATCTVCYGW